MSKTYSAGIVTAYGAAKRAGYTGTYEDFCRQQAGYAESAAAVEQAKNTAVSAANTATAKAGEAATAATAAQTAKAQTEAAADLALTDIGIARSSAIGEVRSKGQIQTENAMAQAQAAATSATTASTKASEASASASTASNKASEAAQSATDANSYKTAAQTAKTAAETAQSAAETAAASVSTSAAQIETNRQDIAAINESLDDVKADLDNNVNDLKSVIANVTGYEAISFTNGKYIKTNLNVGDLVDLTPVTGYNTNNYAIVDAQEGDKFTINATGGKAGRLWCFVDSNNVLLSVAVPGAIATNLILTAPANASKLIFNPVSGYGKIYKGEYLVDVTNGLENHVNALNTSVGTLAEELNGVRADLGDLGDLETTDKSSIVAAINEAAQSGGGGGGSSTLAGLTDTNLSNNTDGQVLTFDATSSKWVNRTPSGGVSVTVDTSLSGTSTNPVQNKVIKQALDTKAGIAVATTSANGLMSATDKSHLDSVYADYSAAITALGA